MPPTPSVEQAEMVNSLEKARRVSFAFWPLLSRVELDCPVFLVGSRALENWAGDWDSSPQVDVDLAVHSLLDFKTRYLMPRILDGLSIQFEQTSSGILLRREGFTAQVFERQKGYEGFYDLSCCRRAIPLHDTHAMHWEGYTSPADPFSLLLFDPGHDWFPRATRRVAKYVTKGFNPDPQVFEVLRQVAAGTPPDRIEGLSFHQLSYEEFQ